MLSKLKFVWCIVSLITCMDLVYGNEIKNLKDVLNKDIPLSEKVKYIQAIKDDDYCLSSKDIDTINFIFFENQYGENPLEDKGVTKNSKKISLEDKGMMDEIRTAILEILLDDKIDGSILTPEQMTTISRHIIHDLSVRFDLPSETRFLSLKVLIKINELKADVDDARSATIRQVEEFVFRENPDFMEEFKKQEANRKKKDFWDYREIVEDSIFAPVLLIDDGIYNTNKDDQKNYYKTEKKEVLEDYERYLVEHIKFFPITENLKKLVEKAFFNTQFVQLRSYYIGAMFTLDMRETLVKIIVDISIDQELREQAISVALKLLDHIDIIHFKKFSISILRGLQNIYSDPKEKKEFKFRVKNEISNVKVRISAHNDMKDLEYVVFNSNISVEDRIEYLNDIAELGMYFSKKDLGIVKKVLDNDDLDIRIKTKISSLILYRTSINDIKKGIEEEDIEAMGYLLMMTGYNVPGPEVNTRFVTKNLELPMLFINCMNKSSVIKQFGRFNMWRKLIPLIDGSIKKYEDSIEKLIIKVCLDLLAKNKKDFEEFSIAFIKALQKISSSPKESNDLKNIADYILIKIKRDDLFLKNAINDCVLNMML